jgi:hypothetical protein
LLTTSETWLLVKSFAWIVSTVSNKWRSDSGSFIGTIDDPYHFGIRYLAVSLWTRKTYIAILMWKTYQFKVSVKDDNYDACKTANSKILGRQNLAKWALTCYGGFTHERLLSESSRPYMLAYYLFLYVLLLCVGQVITVSISSNLMSARKDIML